TRDGAGNGVDFPGELGAVVSGPDDTNKIGRGWRDRGRIRSGIANQADENVVVGIDEDIVRAVQRGAGGIGAVGGNAGGRRSSSHTITRAHKAVNVSGGEGAEGRAGDSDTDGVVATICDVQIAASIKSAAIWKMKVGAGHRAAVAAKQEVCWGLDTNDVVDVPELFARVSTRQAHQDLAHQAVVRVGDPDVVVSIDAHAHWSTEFRVDGQAAVTVVAVPTVAGEHRQLASVGLAGGRDLVNAIRGVI